MPFYQRQKETRAAENEMADRITDSMDINLFGQTPGDSEGQEGLACCSLWDGKGSDMTSRLNNNKCHYHQTISLT